MNTFPAPPTVPVHAGQVRARDLAFLPIHIVIPTLAAVAGLTAIELRLYESPQSYNPITVATSVTVIALIAYSRYVLQLKWLSASNVYLALFWMFHFGLTFPAVLFPDVLLEIR